MPKRQNKPREEELSLRDANLGPVQLGNTKGRMIAGPTWASFLYVDKDGFMCVVPWDEAIKQFGPVKRDG